MAFRRSIIQLKADCCPVDFILVKLHQTYKDGLVEKREVPSKDGGSIEEILYCLKECQEAAAALRFDTGDELFTNFRRIIRSCAKDDWDYIVMNIPNPTPALFDAAIEQWKQEMILPSARQTMVDYHETISKPCNMTVEAFVNRIKVMVCYIGDIPLPRGDPPTINQTKMKNIIFWAMPVAWQTNFLRVHKVSALPVLQLQQFMSQEREFLDCEIFSKGDTHHGNPNRRTENQRDSRASRGRGNFRGTGHGSGRNNYGGTRLPWNNTYGNSRSLGQTMPLLTTIADYTTAHILGHNAGRIQILLTYKEKDEYRRDEAVVETKDDATTTNMALTMMVLTMVLGLVLGISTPRRHINRRILSKSTKHTKPTGSVYTKHEHNSRRDQRNARWL